MFIQDLGVKKNYITAYALLKSCNISEFSAEINHFNLKISMTQKEIELAEILSEKIIHEKLSNIKF